MSSFYPSKYDSSTSKYVTVADCHLFSTAQSQSFNITLQSEIVVSDSLHSHSKASREDYAVMTCPLSSGTEYYSYNTDLISYEPACPSYFFPPLTMHANTILISGTGCAKGCKSPRLEDNVVLIIRIENHLVLWQ